MYQTTTTGHHPQCRETPRAGAKRQDQVTAVRPATAATTGLLTPPLRTMPERPATPHTQAANDRDKIRILQINLNKSEKAHLSYNYDIMLIQEPYTTIFNGIRTPMNFRPIFPTHRYQSQEQIHSIIWVNKRLDTHKWTALDMPGTYDIMAIQLKGPYGVISIFNIYNNCTHSRNKATLQGYIRDHANLILADKNYHMLWARDFNRHHPLWDNDEDVHLFTQQASRASERLIGLIATYNLTMALPKGIPTLQHMVTKRPDNVFNTTGLSELITKCKVDPTLCPTSTDHFPIITNILIPQGRIEAAPSHNFREVNWDDFQKDLRHRINTTPNPSDINNPDQLNSILELLTKTIQETIKVKVKKSKPRPDSKRWWS